MLLATTGMLRGGYHGRITHGDNHVTLSGVTGADEGSYTVMDEDGKILVKLCLNVRGERANEGERFFFLAVDPDSPKRSHLSVGMLLLPLPFERWNSSRPP